MMALPPFAPLLLELALPPLPPFPPVAWLTALVDGCCVVALWSLSQPQLLPCDWALARLKAEPPLPPLALDLAFCSPPLPPSAWLLLSLLALFVAELFVLPSLEGGP